MTAGRDGLGRGGGRHTCAVNLPSSVTASALGPSVAILWLDRSLKRTAAAAVGELHVPVDAPLKHPSRRRASWIARTCSAGSGAAIAGAGGGTTSAVLGAGA